MTDKSIDVLSIISTIISSFRHSDYEVKYRLFKTFCMNLHGCVLWNLSRNSANRVLTHGGNI